MLLAMRRLLTPITIAATGGALLVGAAGGAVVASAAENPAPQPVAPLFHDCVDAAVKAGKLPAKQAERINGRLDKMAARQKVMQELRAAFKAQREKDGVKRLEPSKRQELAKPILDKAVGDGVIPQERADKINERLGSDHPFARKRQGP
jgi:hypothetical protein